MRPVDERRLHGNADGHEWAEEFMAAFGDRLDVIDESLMISWFCNAIETGKIKGRERGYQEGLAEANGRLAAADDALVQMRRFVADALERSGSAGEILAQHAGAPRLFGEGVNVGIKAALEQMAAFLERL